jgi:hypothetical protein
MNNRKVFAGLAAVRDHLAKEGLGKNQTNQHQGFKFRGIDDLLGILQPALNSGKTIMLPSVLEIDRQQYTTAKGSLQFYTVVKVRYTFISEEDGSEYSVDYAGEAADTGDKSLSKALTMSFKSLAFHAFQIPLNGSDDADRHIADETAPPPVPDDVSSALVAAASVGTDALKAAWRETPAETRELVTKFHAKFWADLKAQARAVDGEAPLRAAIEKHIAASLPQENAVPGA